VTLVVRPSNIAGDQVSRFFGKAQPGTENDERAMTIMADKSRDFESMLADTNPVRLGLYERDGVMFSQPMEVLHFILTGDRLRIPLVHGRLGQAIYNSRIIFGREAAEIRLPNKSHYLGMFGVREYVAQTRSGQFNSLLTLDFPYVLTQSFAPLVKSVASERFQKKYKQMVSSDDAGVSQAEELLDGVDDLMSNRFVMGEHHLSIAVIDDTPNAFSNGSLSHAQRQPIPAWSWLGKTWHSKRPFGHSFPAISNCALGQRSSTAAILQR
jgi:type IV secretion system protein VirB4